MRSPQSYRPSARLTNGLILGCSCSPFSSQIMLSSEKEFTAEKTLFQFDFGLASGLFFFFKWLHRMQLHHDRGHLSGSGSSQE